MKIFQKIITFIISAIFAGSMIGWALGIPICFLISIGFGAYLVIMHLIDPTYFTDGL